MSKLSLVEGHQKFPGPVRCLPPEAQAIRAARRALGLTQAKCAERWGVCERTVQDWEAGRVEDAMVRAILRDGVEMKRAA